MATNNPKDSSGDAQLNGDWRASVSQKHRETEVREIAKVLASLEPGATTGSKLMLAMRFEQQIFTTATSLAEYRKKLSKRLKKLKKNYKPPQEAAKNATDNEQRVLELRRKYGDALTFIYKYDEKAIAAMREKSGAEKAKHLQQHTDNARSWATQLGLSPLSNPKTIPKLESSELDRLQKHLELRVENIRSHVVKLTQPDLFLEERLVELEQNLKDEPSKLLAKAMEKKFNSLGWTEFHDPPKMLQNSLETAFQNIPPPSRDPRSKKNTALAHLEAMRASSQSYLAYMVTVPKHSVEIPKGAIPKCHTIAVDGISFLEELMPSKDTSSSKCRGVTLEDAWNKIMEAPTQDDPEDSLMNNTSQDSGSISNKGNQNTIIKSRILLTSGRPCPSNLLPALKRKGATLHHPTGDGAYLVLDFSAFVLTVYLVPLVVTFCPKESEGAVSVWGADGSWETLGHIVQDRLDHAAAQATQILRTYFGKVRARSDFEVEIGEGTALLNFLQLARITYIPDWQDIEN